MLTLHLQLDNDSIKSLLSIPSHSPATIRIIIDLIVLELQGYGGWVEVQVRVQLIILITNKMKIITHLQVLSQLVLRKTKYSFGSIRKDSHLTYEDLLIKPPQSITSESSKPAINNSLHRSFRGELASLHNNQEEISLKQQHTLKLMDQAFSKVVAKTTFSCFRNEHIDAEMQIENAVAFMKYLDHSLEKNDALEIVSMIEKNYFHNHPANRQLSNFQKMGSNLEKGRIPTEQLFTNIRHHLIHSLNFYAENLEVNNKLINSLFEILVESNPAFITVENFERECFTLDEEERQQQFTGKQYFQASCGAKYFDHQKSDASSPNEEKDKNKHKTALQQAFQLKDRTKFSKLYLKKVVELEEGQGNEQRLKLASEKVVFCKKNINKTMVSKQTQEQDLKSAYIYELPFNINEEEADEFIRYLESSKGIKVESYVLFPYKNFIQKNHHEIIFRVPDKFQEDKNAHIEREIKNIEIDELTKVNSTANKNEKQRYVSRSKKQKSKFDDVPLENEPSRMKSVTEALLLKIKKESYSKFNKSSMLIKFATKEDKQAVLSPESRLYGLNYKGFKNVKFQEGFCKTIITLTGIPWGCPSRELERYLNKILEPEKIPVKVEENCILTKSSIAIKFDHLSEALLAIQKLSNITFQNKQLKAHLSYGSCKVFNSEYHVSMEDSYERLKQKISESGMYYSQKYEAEESKTSE